MAAGGFTSGRTRKTKRRKKEDVGERARVLTGGCDVNPAIKVDLSRNARFYPAVLRPHATVVICGMSADESSLPRLIQNSVLGIVCSGFILV
jgi:hypothetical protein